ncbi:hypothetical protein M1N55_03590 [Dehalococcoidia bacterium]|nr:hypothetical protein [Dehalococcoidia bacterium]
MKNKTRVLGLALIGLSLLIGLLMSFEDGPFLFILLAAGLVILFISYRKNTKWKKQSDDIREISGYCGFCGSTIFSPVPKLCYSCKKPLEISD